MWTYLFYYVLRLKVFFKSWKYIRNHLKSPWRTYKQRIVRSKLNRYFLSLSEFVYDITITLRISHVFSGTWKYCEKHGIHLQSDSENSQFALDCHGIIAQASPRKACAQDSVLDDNNHHHQLSLYTFHWAQASFGTWGLAHKFQNYTRVHMQVHTCCKY